MIELEAMLEDVGRRLTAKRLFGSDADSLSLRVPGADEALFKTPNGEPRLVSLQQLGDGDEALHVRTYRARPDVGGVLLGTTPWTNALCAMNAALPSLFDEQARHIGRTGPPVSGADDLVAALQLGGNAAFIDGRRLVLGSTPNRVVLNADLLDKCTKAFVLAASSGASVSPLPSWASELWYRRLHDDQRRASDAYLSGLVPSGMDAY